MHEEIRTFRPRSGRGRGSLLLLPGNPFLAILVICIGSVVVVVILVFSMVFVALKVVGSRAIRTHDCKDDIPSLPHPWESAKVRTEKGEEGRLTYSLWGVDGPGTGLSKIAEVSSTYSASPSASASGSGSGSGGWREGGRLSSSESTSMLSSLS